MKRTLWVCLRQLILNGRFFVLMMLGKTFLRPMSSPELTKRPINRVLVIAQPRIGDAIMSLPMIRQLRKQLPTAVIEVCANRYCGKLFSLSEDINHVHCWPGHLSVIGSLRVVFGLRKRRYDLVFDLNIDYTLLPSIAARIASSYRCIGFNISGRGVFLDTALPEPSIEMHCADVLCSLLPPAGLQRSALGSEQVPQPLLRISETIGKSVESILTSAKYSTESGPLIAIHPGGHYPTQQWFPERFAALADRLVGQQSATILLLGDTRETALIEHIQRVMKAPVIVFVNHSLDRVIGMISRCQLLICNNSGLLHVAGALGVPTVSTMGPTLASRWWPRGAYQRVVRKEALSCIGCGSGVCSMGTMACMDQISVDEMHEAAVAALQWSAGR